MHLQEEVMYHINVHSIFHTLFVGCCMYIYIYICVCISMYYMATEIVCDNCIICIQMFVNT